MDIQAHLSLADHAAYVNGRFYINGGGWNLRAPVPVPWALVIEVRVPWHENNRKVPFKLELLDADGGVVDVTTPGGSKPLMLEGDLKLTANQMLKPGSTIVGGNALILPPMPLAPNSQFEFKLTIDGHTKDEWRVTFSTVDQPQQLRQAS